jgi:hypothetical protein
VIVWSLFACAEPPVLDAVTEELSAGAVSAGTQPLRMMTALVGALSEGCSVESIDGYTFTGPSANALGLGAPVVEHGETSQTWTFLGVGLDDADGTLVVTTDLDRQDLALTYTTDSVLLTAGIVEQVCETTTDRAVFSGTGTWTEGGVASQLNIVAVSPEVGLEFSPTLLIAPASGQVRWADEDDGWVILLDDAATIDHAADTWPGLASGKDWSREIAIALP